MQQGFLQDIILCKNLQCLSDVLLKNIIFSHWHIFSSRGSSVWRAKKMRPEQFPTLRSVFFFILFLSPSLVVILVGRCYDHNCGLYDFCTCLCSNLDLFMCIYNFCTLGRHNLIPLYIVLQKCLEWQMIRLELEILPVNVLLFLSLIIRPAGGGSEASF